MKNSAKPFILGINGSPYLDGNTALLLKLVLNGAKRVGAKTKIINLYQLNIRPESGHYSKNPKKAILKNLPKDGMAKLYPEILKADGLVLATPTYWANMSGAVLDLTYSRGRS